jgi:NodT family efflux transporter outer membrane factor (OMF) lipoprotein
MKKKRFFRCVVAPLRETFFSQSRLQIAHLHLNEASFASRNGATAQRQEQAVPRITSLKAMLSLTAALLSACAVGPDYQPPKVETPTQWAEAPTAAKDSLRLNSWWRTFNDPVLDHLIDEAILSNLDLKLAETRIREARATYIGTIAAGLPNVNGRSNLMRRRNNTNVSTSGSNSSGGSFGSSDQIINIFQLGFDASWEIDLFGGVRRAVEAADANLESEEEGRRDVLVTLLAEVARNYIELRANQKLLAVTNENLHSQEETLQLTQLRRQAGLASELEVAQSDALTAETRAQAPVYATTIKQAIHAISLLLGKPPGALAARLEPESPLPTSADPGLADLPAEVLRRRPDIRKAERKIAQSSAEVGVATSELYPKISLTAFLGLQNTNIAAITPLGKSWSLASSLSTPIFNWGRIKANIEAKQALNDQAFISYQSTVLKAYKEVEDALVAHAQENQRIAALRQSVDAQKLAVSLSTERWRNGLSAYLDVLAAERGLFQGQRDLVDSQAKQSSQLVALYKALGGGWQAGEPLKPPESDYVTKPAEFILDQLHGDKAHH